MQCKSCHDALTKSTSDLVPAVFLLSCALVWNLARSAPLVQTLNGMARRIEYSVLYFILYLSDIAMTTTAICTLYAKTGQMNNANGDVGNAGHIARRNLRHLILFSLSPSIVQIPYALRQISTLMLGPYFAYGHGVAEYVSGNYPRAKAAHRFSVRFSFWVHLNVYMYDVVDVLFALKPSIDAASALLFLGEYRKNAAAVLRKLRWFFRRAYTFAVGCRRLRNECERNAYHFANAEHVHIGALRNFGLTTRSLLV